MAALLVGSIGALVETSEVQRAAFNEAFERHGLDWHWSQSEYQTLLARSGGRHRIAEYANQRGEKVDAAEVHRTKSKLFQALLRNGEIELRPGVREMVSRAKDLGMQVALVTTTSRENVNALLASAANSLAVEEFDLIVDVTLVSSPKPAGECYEFALRELGESAGQCLAVEDNVDGVAAAKAAGLLCVAFPGRNTSDHDYSAADWRMDRLDPSLLQQSLLADKQA